MADYAIGDVQGCYTPLMRLLESIHYDASQDRLWFVGDLVNRGLESLQVLRFIYTLKPPAIITLGNHDLSLLVQLFTNSHVLKDNETLKDVLHAEDRFELGHWLRKQPLFYEDQVLNVIMVHAGIPPMWTIQETHGYAQEVMAVLSGERFQDFLNHLYGNTPTLWSSRLQGYARWRCIINYLTRMRCCDEVGRLNLIYTGHLQSIPPGLIPWFKHPKRHVISQTIVFGHWAALETTNPVQNVYALDTGCVWGETLTALRLQDKHIFSVSMKQ